MKNFIKTQPKADEVGNSTFGSVSHRLCDFETHRVQTSFRIWYGTVYTLIPTSKIDCKTKNPTQPVTLKLRTVLEFSNDRESMREFVNCAVYFDATERKIHGENITIQYKIELLNVCFTIITSKANQTLTNETKQTNRRWRRRYVLERETTHQYETELGKRVITVKRCKKR